MGNSGGKNAISRGLSGKVAVITGASQGFGAELAKQLASHGCNVVISSRSMERLQKRAGLINAEFKENPKAGKVIAIVADVAKSQDCVELVKKTVERLGKLDYMVCNAGVNSDAELIEMDPECSALRTAMEINVMGPAMCTRAALSELAKTKGQVVAISSLAGHVALPVASAYSASKFALEGFFNAIRPELAFKGVGVLIVEPGAMEHPDEAPRSLVNQQGQVVAADPTSDRYAAQDKSKEESAKRHPTNKIVRRVVKSMAMRTESEIFSGGITQVLKVHVLRILAPRTVEARVSKLRASEFLGADFVPSL